LIKVLDAKTGQAIPGASVELTSAYENYGQKETDNEGKTRIEASLPASGNFSLFHRSGGVYLLGLKIKVESDAYEAGFLDLEEKFGSWPLYGPPLPEIEIRLHKK
jgi:hypothetical protein